MDTNQTSSVTAGHVREELRHILNDAEYENRITLIERYGNPVAAVVPISWMNRAAALMAQAAGN